MALKPPKPATRPAANPRGDIHRHRRQDLMDFMRGGIAIIPTAPQQPRNGDVLYPYRPDSDFYYLTHFPEPNAIAVLAPGNPDGEYILFCQERDPKAELWDGRRHGLQGACETFAADQSFPIKEFHDRLPALLKNRERVFVTMGRYPDFDRRLIDCTRNLRESQRAGIHPPAEFVDLGRILHEFRLIKKPDEQKLMRRAAQISAAGHRRAMRTTTPGQYEYQVQAELECEFALGGGTTPAYPSIVASGENACILHYTENHARLQDGDLLLIDAGAELDCYAADITRTFPVNGKFTPEQRALYEIVLTAQRAAIQSVQPQQPVSQYHETATRALTEGLTELGLLKGSREELMETRAYEQFYMHRTGHWLGMDVHDVGDYKVDEQWRLLEPGMVLTVEPGLYITPHKKVPPKWHNIGIRIEDDILVTRTGNENLSADAPVEIADIETLMAEKVAQ